jgi:hypothetical protein
MCLIERSCFARQHFKYNHKDVLTLEFGIDILFRNVSDEQTYAAQKPRKANFSTTCQAQINANGSVVIGGITSDLYEIFPQIRS